MKRNCNEFKDLYVCHPKPWHVIGTGGYRPAESKSFMKRDISYYAKADFAIRWDNLNRCTKKKKNGR